MSAPVRTWWLACVVLAGSACGAGRDGALGVEGAGGPARAPDGTLRGAAFARPDPALREARPDDRRIDLAAAAWERDGEPADPLARQGRVELPCTARGTRWTTVFTTSRHDTWRAILELDAGPDGPLYEVVLDGRRLRPTRDAWRPTPRRVRVDLGSVWLGGGRHLLELVAREEREDAALRPRALVLRRLPR